MVDALKFLWIAIWFFPALVYADDHAAAPVLIDPTIQSYDGLSSRKLSGSFFVDKVDDNRANAFSDTLGIFQSGKKNTVPVVTRLVPSDLLKNSIQGMLRELSVLSPERINAVYAIQAEVLLFEITEADKGMGHEVRAMFGFKVKIIRVASNEVIWQSIVTGEDSRKAFDAKKIAESVASNAVFNGILRLLQNLSSLK